MSKSSCKIHKCVHTLPKIFTATEEVILWHSCTEAVDMFRKTTQQTAFDRFQSWRG